MAFRVSADEQIRKDFLLAEKKKCIENIAKRDIDIRILKRTDPTAVVAKKQLTPESTRDITAKDMLETQEMNRAGAVVRLNTINMLLDGKEDEPKEKGKK